MMTRSDAGSGYTRLESGVVDTLLLITIVVAFVQRAPAQGVYLPNGEPPSMNSGVAYGEKATTPDRNTISGRVTRSAAQPLREATVYLFQVFGPEEDRKLLAQQKIDKEGNYRFEQVIRGGPPAEADAAAAEQFEPPYWYEVVVRAPGFATRARGYGPHQVVTTGVVFNLDVQPPAKLTGRITGPDGKPVAQAIVKVRKAPFSSNWKEVNTTRTDADGKYQIDDLPPFQQNADGIACGHLADSYSEEVRITTATIRIDSPTLATKLIPVKEVPGTADAKLELPGRLEGRVVDAATGQPVPDQLVRAVTLVPCPPSPEFFSERVFEVTHTDHEGKYCFATLRPAKYDVWVELADGTTRGLPQLAVAKEKTLTAPDIALTASGVARVRLVEARTHTPMTVPPGMHLSLSCFKLPADFPCSKKTSLPFLTKNAGDRIELRLPPGKNDIFLEFTMTVPNPGWDFPGGRSFELAAGQVVDLDLGLLDMSGNVPSVDLSQASSEEQEKWVRLYQSIRDLTEKLMQHPEDVEALITRAADFEMLGNERVAVEEYERCLKLKLPGKLEKRVNKKVAFLRATAANNDLRNGKRAVELAERAKSLMEKPEPDILDTLAAAYAETGDFERAIQAEHEAIETASDQQRDEFRQYLKLYESHQPRRKSRPPAPKQ